MECHVTNAVVWGFLGTGGFVKDCHQLRLRLEGKGLDCVSRPPFVFIIPQALWSPWQPRLQVAKFKTIYFQARSFADITHPHEKGLKCSWVLTVVCAHLNTQEPSLCLFLHVCLSNDVQAELGSLLLNDQHNNAEHHVRSLHCGETSLSFRVPQTETHS